MPPEKGYAKNSYWMYAILIDEEVFGHSKEEVRRLLKKNHGIDTRDFFYPLHKQPAMVKNGYVNADASMSVSERLWRQGLYLPSSTNLTEGEIHCVVKAMRQTKESRN